MDELCAAQVMDLRAAWSAQWVAAASGDADRRDGLVDRYVELHAAAVVLAEAPAVRGRLTDLVAVHEELGRTASSRRVGEIELTTAMLGARLSPEAGPLLPVFADHGRSAPRVERSRPGWRLDGVVPDVAWDPDVPRIAAFAVDEGDNEVVTVLDLAQLVAQEKVMIADELTGGRQIATVRLHEVVLAEADVVHVPGLRDRLADRLAVLAAADALGAAAWLLASTGEAADGHPFGGSLVASRRVLLSAASAASRSPLVVSHHDVSAALLRVIQVCQAIAAHVQAQPGTMEPAATTRIDRIRLANRLAPWHRRRLVPLI